MLVNGGVPIEETTLAEAQGLALYLKDKGDTTHRNYTESVEIAGELSVHLTYDGDISGLISKQRPNEPSFINAYRTDSWQPVTASFMGRVSGYTDRVLDKKFWEVDAEGEIREYLAAMPMYGDHFHFLQKVLKPSMLRDPNAWVCVVSRYPVNEAAENDMLPEPVPMIVPSENVVYYDDRQVVILSTEQNPVKQGESHYNGEVYWLFTDSATYKAIQVEEQEDNKFEVYVWERHDWGRVPCMQLGGRLAAQRNVMDFRAKPLWLSFLQPCLPWLNKYASLDSDEQAHYLLHIYLQKYEAQQPCSKCGGEGQVQVNYLSGIDWTTCGHCKGSKVEPAGGVFNVLRVQPDENGAVGAPAGYIAPPTNIVENIGAKLQEWMRQAFGAVGLEFLLQQDNGRQTAEAKMLDRDETQAFLQSLADRLALVGNFVFDAMNYLRYHVYLGEDLAESYFRISPKDTFTVETLDMARMAVEVAEQNNLHTEQKRQAALSYAAQLYGAESTKYKRLETVLLLDPTFGMSSDDVETAVVNGAISEQDVRFGQQISQILESVIENNADFFTLPLAERKALLMASLNA